MFQKNILVLVLCSVVICESAFVDTLEKCSKDDSECQRQLIQKAVITIGEKGAPEHGIPPIDPAVVKNVTVSILDVLEITFDGIVKGIKKAILNKFSLNLDDGIASLDITCDVVVKGKYKLVASSPILKNLLGDEVHGDGEGKIKIEKLNINAAMLFDVVKRGDDIFLIGKKDKLTYSYDIQGKITFAANNLYVGDKESSATVVKLLNENWKVLAGSFGKNFIDVAINFLYNFVNQILSNVPAKHYFIEDLSSYVKN